MARSCLAAAVIVILAIAVLRIAPGGPVAGWLHLSAWTALALLSLRSAWVQPQRGNAAVTVALAVAAILIVRFGRYECWSLFATLCDRAPDARHVGWDIVYVNQDTFTYLERFGAHSLRPPLYGWFAHAATLFTAGTQDLLQETRKLIPYEADVAGLVAHVRQHPPVALLQIAQAQQLALWGAVIFFVWSAARRVPVLGVAAVVLALYDGGVLTHGYYAHAIEGKILYLAGLFFAAGATLMVAVKPTLWALRLATLACAALPLIRPQGIVAGLLLAAACFRFVRAAPRSRGSIGIAAAAMAAFLAAAALPAVVTYIGLGVVQPANIYAMARMQVALELATPDDVAHMPDDVSRRFLGEMLAMRDAGPRPADLQQSLSRNQGIAMQACIKTGGAEMRRLICVNAMSAVARTVLGRHTGDYVRRIVIPSMIALAPLHVGGAVSFFPVSLLAGAVLVAILAFTAPWLALWGGAVIALHVSLVVLLSMFAARIGAYLITSEPVLLCVLAVMAVCAVQTGASRVRAGTAARQGR